MLKTLLKQVKEYKLASFLTPLFMVLEVICEMIIPILMAKIVDDGIGFNNPNGGSMGVIFRVGAMMIVIALLGLFAGLGGAYYGSQASTGFAKNLRKAMFDNIQTFSFANIDKFSTSGLVTRLTTDVTNIQNAYMMTLRMAMRAPASLIIAMVAAFTISPRLASIYLVAVLFLSVLMVIIMNTATKYFKQVFEKYDKLNESVQENVSAIRVVKAYVREEYENDKFKKAALNIYHMFVKAEKNLVMISPVMSGTVYICILLVSWFGAHMIVSNELTTGGLMSLLTYCMTILMNLMMLGMIFVMLTMAQASGKRIAEVIEEKATITNKDGAVKEVKDGSISFEHVDFAYNTTSEEPVLKDINLDIKSGETIGIIGGTGSAKSSLVNLISRLYDVTKGSIKVGGVDVRDYDMETLRDQVSVVLQKNVLFSGTILDNLRWGDKNATEEECKRACRMACADEFIERMPDGYNTEIEQSGTNVSGGQRQRLCIARALLKKPKILILDDSTSAVDTATDAKIRKAFAEEIPGTTKLIIAQRISSVQNCDRIIVMDDGCVNGFGTHEELLKTNEIYREVYESQTGASGDADFDQAG
ncbi:ABC transporter ATP-binding protein/permease [Butyrivibrio sp. DSM 10294]|uniref:ABC transporter ATP-binding protein n=1 Tax=Butyrivibrio sp. DSM 10294 TaxID=2972457 RepID=UPI00234E429A|nr:ABC transporter ATP-binding protein [Butyrivibrio sp. DSM 10294]MDC7294398.1 ABC transporter ATP-binding protein/permease [Butyrivibrio sp. DSM 10294]